METDGPSPGPLSSPVPVAGSPWEAVVQVVNMTI